MTKYSVYILFTLMVFTSFKAFSQTKNEQETRIDAKSFPKNALQLLDHLPKNCKHIKFYKETDNDKTSYEAKLKLNRKRYSIEFDENGNLEDVEITIKLKNIHKNLLQTIEDYFKNNYKKHWILKVQKQYNNSTSKDDLTILKLAVENSNNSKVNFEIIVQIQTEESKTEIKEFTFDYSGNILKSRLVEPSSYEHVLY